MGLGASFVAGGIYGGLKRKMDVSFAWSLPSALGIRTYGFGVKRSYQHSKGKERMIEI